MSPDVFLSRHQIRTDFGLTPAEMVSALKTLNLTRTISTDGESLEEIVYQTEGLTVGRRLDPHEIDPADIKKEADLVASYSGVLKTGNRNSVHTLTDSINKLRAKMGIRLFSPDSEFVILTRGLDPVGQLARRILSDREKLKDGEELSGSAIPWFDTVQGFNELTAYNGLSSKQETTPILD